MAPTQQEIDAGQAVYTKTTLSAYDIIVHGITNHFIWKCPTAKIVAHYDRHISANHLDVGVGTGYFLDRCRFPSATPRVALMDLNENTLEHASRRIARYHPETFRQNILEPIQIPITPFNSVGINYLLHCIPGSISEKAAALDYLKTLMNPGATLFGSTVLSGGVKRNWAAKRLMALYNRQGIFANTADDLAGLEAALRARFDNVSVEVEGCVALFSGRTGQA